MSLLTVIEIVSPNVDFEDLVDSFQTAEPFNHVVIDNFFEPEIAEGLAKEFPEFDSKVWWEYDNPIEIKKACNIWDKFPKLTYSVFTYLNSQNSWHGLPEPVKSPDGICRNSIATYYLCEPRAGAAERGRALFAPSADQAKDESVLELIKQRSQVGTSASVYRSKN